VSRKRWKTNTFVNVKVDREESPDIDQIYQVAQGDATQRKRGWPLTMFLTPDQVPVLAALLPKIARYGLPGFEEAASACEVLRRGGDEIREQNAQLLQSLVAHRPALPAGR